MQDIAACHFHSAPEMRAMSPPKLLVYAQCLPVDFLSRRGSQAAEDWHDGAETDNRNPLAHDLVARSPRKSGV